MFDPFNIPNLNISGEVERKFYKYRKFIYIFMVIYVIFLFSTPNNIIQIDNDIIKYFYLFIYLWVYLSIFILYSFKRHFKYNFLIIVCFFPFLFPIYVSTKLLVKYLKSKYPNSDDEEYLKNFERIKKIKKLYDSHI
jgi:hypothetical protein